MGSSLELRAVDGHHFSVYRSDPVLPPKGAVIVLQEIFGVTDHIRSVADRYAAAGYLALAPAMFDRIRPGIELTGQESEAARGYAAQLQETDTVADLKATVGFASVAGKVGVVGYCWGGTVAYIAACRLPIAAAVSYYGTRTQHYLSEHPQCPMLYHFGELDSLIPATAITQIKEANPEGEFHVYAGAGHAFNNEQRPDRYHPAAAQLAYQRTLDFLQRHLG